MTAEERLRLHWIETVAIESAILLHALFVESALFPKAGSLHMNDHRMMTAARSLYQEYKLTRPTDG